MGRGGRGRTEGSGTGLGARAWSTGEPYSSCFHLHPKAHVSPEWPRGTLLIQAANQMPGTSTKGRQFLPSQNLKSSGNTAVNRLNTMVIYLMQKICSFISLFSGWGIFWLWDFITIWEACLQCWILRFQEKYHGIRASSWSATDTGYPEGEGEGTTLSWSPRTLCSGAEGLWASMVLIQPFQSCLRFREDFSWILIKLIFRGRPTRLVEGCFLWHEKKMILAWRHQAGQIELSA